MPDTKQPLVIYHANCADGFTAAWACWLNHPGWDYYAATHGDPPPDCTGRVVYMLDFAYKLPVMREILAVARNVIVLDHHKSAEEDLRTLLADGEIEGTFNMDRSGARLAWDYFHGDSLSGLNDSAPILVRIVEDRDLWRFAMAETRSVMAWIFSYDYDFRVWNDLRERLDTCEGVYVAECEGAAIMRKQMKDIREFIEVAATTEVIGGHEVPVLNAPYFWSSEAGHLLAEGEPFAACYWDTPEGRVYSLRSTENGVDVSEIARAYGGGGHRNAAGFRVDRQAA